MELHKLLLPLIASVILVFVEVPLYTRGMNGLKEVSFVERFAEELHRSP